MKYRKKKKTQKEKFIYSWIEHVELMYLDQSAFVVEHFYVHQDHLKFLQVLIESIDCDQWVLDYCDVMMNDDFVRIFDVDFETKYLKNLKGHFIFEE